MVEEYNNLIQQEKEEIEWIKSEIEEKKDIKHEKKTFEEEYTQWTYLNQRLDEQLKELKYNNMLKMAHQTWDI